MPNIDYALEMLKQYYEDLRSIYDSLFQIFKLFSISIVFSGTALGLFFKDKSNNTNYEVFLVIYAVMVFISLFCVLLTLGQAYRYRITQHFCRSIRTSKECDHYVSSSVYGKGNYLQKSLPTLFLYTYLFFACFICIISSLLAWLYIHAKEIPCEYKYILAFLFFISLVSIFFATKKHNKKTKETIKALKNKNYSVCFLSDENYNIHNFNENTAEQLDSAINYCIGQGYHTFLGGADDDFDTMAINQISGLKSQLPYITFTAVVPHSRVKSLRKDKETKNKIDDIIPVAKNAFKKEKYIRGRYLVDNASLLICYCNNLPSITKNIMDYANSKQLKIINIFDLTINTGSLSQYIVRKEQKEMLSEDLLLLTEDLAEHVHNTWVEGRIKDGWQYGSERDDTLKTHPCLVPYNELSEVEKEYDRRTSQETLKFILNKGFTIAKNMGEKS